jgi:predicted glutamine amidotransferase
MCGGSRARRATFWLVKAPDSLAAQSVREPDGTGLGWFDAAEPRVQKEPVRADQDENFLHSARTVTSRTFLAHVRWAYTGAVSPRNTQPFEADGALFVHQGLVLELDRVDEQLDADRALVRGDTDSERIFALIRREARARGGDWAAGITAAANWLADAVPVFGLNLILATATDLYALRYPDSQPVYVLDRRTPGITREAIGTHLSVRYQPRAVIVASERLDGESRWLPLEAGELLHVDGALGVTRQTVRDRPPVRPLALKDLDLPAGIKA